MRGAGSAGPLEKPGARRRSKRAVARALVRARAVTCSEHTLLNHLLAKGPGPRRKDAAVHRELEFDGLLADARLDPEAVLRFAIETITEAASGPVVEMPTAAFAEALGSERLTRERWF